MDPTVRQTIETYDDVAAEYESRNSDRTAISDQCERFCTACSGTRVLDIGCGPGWETATFDRLGYDVVGIDLSVSFLSRTADRVPGRAVRMDMRRLGLETASFDGIWACASFLHVPGEDARHTLEEFRRVLDSGTVALSVKQGHGQTTADTYQNDRRSFTRYSPATLRETVDEAGMSVIELDDRQSEWIFCLAETD